MTCVIRGSRSRFPLQSRNLAGLLFAAAVLTCAPAMSAEGGPDIAGYTWVDTASGGPAYDYEVDNSAPLAPLGNRPNDSDDSMGTVTIGFDFPFYGESYSEIDIHSNGGLSFGATSYLDPSHDCGSLAFDAPTILPYWVDLFPGTSSNNGVYYWMGGTEPNRYFVVEWYEVALYRGDGNYSQSDRLTFEAKLFEDGRIEFHFADVNGDGANDNGAEAAILLAGKSPGTNNASVLVVSCDTEAVAFSGNAIGFFPPNCSDEDNDGVRGCDGDCDDQDETVFPGAPEICDGLDNDCDSILPANEVDLDGDFWLPCGGDCDDNNSELNGVDNDGDGFSTCTGDCDDNDAGATPEDQDGTESPAAMGIVMTATPKLAMRMSTTTACRAVRGIATTTTTPSDRAMASSVTASTMTVMARLTRTQIAKAEGVTEGQGTTSPTAAS